MTSETTALVLVVLIIAPFFVYYCVKFGTLGFYRAKQLLFQENETSFQEYLKTCPPNEKKKSDRSDTPTLKR
jgi:hypothetical protein